MGVVIELSASEMPRFLPPPEFSAPFASPSLRWGRKRRLRCFNFATAAVRFSPSSYPGSTDGPRQRVASSPARKPSPESPPHPWVCCPSPSLPPPSARPRGPIRLTYPPEDGEEGTSALPPVPPPDLPSGVPAETAEARNEESRPGGGVLGWTLRSRVRGDGGLEVAKRKKRKVELWVSLSRDEIEEDFLWMTGAKPPRRSRRRSKVESDQLQGVFPGSWLPSKITADRYKVAEPSDCRRG